ncbi:MAG: uracil-DNA glycosylase [Arcobacter sp.]|nr:MAG: uracil-DNA glycosylase [Arcobacter sp.]
MKLNAKWKSLLSDELNKPYFKDLMSFLEDEQKTQTTFPVDENIFSAFNLTSFDDIKVVVLGQDPYHGKGQGHGLAFSVQGGITFPPSLKNIFKEYIDDLGFDIPVSGNLTLWAEKGVFLLNTVLTVRESHAHSHKNKGWEVFTDAVIKIISDRKKYVVFILWGKPAQFKSKLIDESKHLILRAPHPSPLSSYRGFFGSKPFSKVNTYLKSHNINEIDWKLK